jgi:hypothetical protein
VCLKDVGEIGLCLNIRKLTGWWKKGRPKDRLVEGKVAKGLFICANLFEKKGCAVFGAEEREKGQRFHSSGAFLEIFTCWKTESSFVKS